MQRADMAMVPVGPKIGITTLKAAVRDVARIAGAVYGAFGDMRLTFSDIKYIRPLIGGLMNLKTVTLAQLYSELHDLDEQESEELANCFRIEFRLDGADSVEEAIEKGMDILFELLPGIMKLSSLGQHVANSSSPTTHLI